MGEIQNGARGEMSRRDFVQAVAIGSAAIVGGCGGDGGDGGDDRDGGDGVPDGSAVRDAGGNRPPVWLALPTIAFTQGVPSRLSIADLVSDPDGDPLTLTKNDVPLPAGVTFDAAARELVYDGVGSVGSSDGHVLFADDGRG